MLRHALLEETWQDARHSAPVLFCFLLLSSSSSFHLSGAVSAHGHTCAHTSYLSDVDANLPRSTFASAKSKKKKKRFSKTCTTTLRWRVSKSRGRSCGSEPVTLVKLGFSFSPFKLKVKGIISCEIKFSHNFHIFSHRSFVTFFHCVY